MNQNEKLELIAKEILGVETLETRNSDELDFHNISVWELKMALGMAFQANYKDKYAKAIELWGDMNIYDYLKYSDPSDTLHEAFGENANDIGDQYLNGYTMEEAIELWEYYILNCVTIGDILGIKRPKVKIRRKRNE